MMQQASGNCPTSHGALDRRAALRLFISGAALALSSCGRPAQQIVPYVDMPDGEVPGIPRRFATALPLAGYGRGVIATSVEGRPIKINGNPRHPASLGATDIFAEAAVLSLYDPDRSKAPYSAGRVQPWSAFQSALLPRLNAATARQGAGLALVTGRVTSPTLLDQITTFKRTFPQAQWYRYEPVEDDAASAGAVLAFDRAATVVPRFSDARVAMMLDADPLGFGPQQIRYGRDITTARRSRQPADSLRLYVAEPAYTLTGALADHRVSLRPELVRNVAIEIARALGAPLAAAELPPDVGHFARVAADDLGARRGAALVQAGPRQGSDVHALCHWINAQLSAPLDCIAPVDPVEAGHGESLRALSDALQARRIDFLIVIGANPAYDTPGELGIAEGLASIPFSVHLGTHRDETGTRCTWHLPLSHVLEEWSDIRATDGTASIIQPLIQPLYDTRSAHDLLAFLNGSLSTSAHELVRARWRASRSSGENFDGWWRQALQDGLIADSASPKVTLPTAKLPQVAPAKPTTGFVLTLAPDPAVFDGSVANNAWLQECPKPFSKQVWGNALHLAEEDARNLGLVDGDMLRITAGHHVVEAPLFVQPAQATGTIAGTIGYGRTAAGSMGNSVGFDLYALRQTDSPWALDVNVGRATGAQNLLRTEHFFTLEGDAAKLQPRFDLADLFKPDLGLSKPGANPPTLYPPHRYDTYEWAMVIDNAACIGCNACVIACQAENNIPIVGPDEIAEGRDMHWLRVDEYVVGGRPGFSPVPCMQCEHAPCEPVCPVAASVHDSEGLNAQVYNRCVGTRFCQSNCPYKVRRFNFFGYADGQEYGKFGSDIVKAVFNPDVSVRGRGVMEKCTYCVQRISGARRAAEKEGRTIRDGEVVTACQAACPTRAISFGNLADPQAAIHALRDAPQSYALLGELGTRPRTTYLARLRNHNPDLGKTQS
jgi:Fe-S-cluster-containing dehydrogenase component